MLKEREDITRDREVKKWITRKRPSCNTARGMIYENNVLPTTSQWLSLN